MQGERRLQQALQGPPGTQPGQHGKHLVHVLANFLISGNQAKVRVQASSARVIVTRTQMAITPDRPPFTTQHQGHLGVGLVTHHPVTDVCSHLFQLGGPIDIGLFVKTSHQLHHHRYLFASTRRRQEDIHQLRIFTSTVNRLLDTDDGRVRRCGTQEAQDGLEGLIRMVQQLVFAGNRLKKLCGGFK